jgi:hypothetical protein
MMVVMRNKKERIKPIKLEERMLAYVESVEDTEGSNYLLNVKTLNGLLVLRYWNLRNKSSFPVPGDFIEIRIENMAKAEAELQKWSSLSLDSTSNKPFHCSLVPINEEDVPEETRCRIKKDRTKQKVKALELLKDDSCWKDKSLHSFLMGFFKSNMDKFTSVPAAVGHHHAYRGGLFIHTAHVFSLCHGIVNNLMCEFDQVDSDILYTAAWFHDTGKLDVYSMDGEVPIIDSEKESMMGHITLSDRIFRRAAEQFGLPEKFIDRVSHCILSHHDRREWDTVVEPKTIEATILCRADYISSRMPD